MGPLVKVTPLLTGIRDHCARTKPAPGRRGGGITSIGNWVTIAGAIFRLRHPRRAQAQAAAGAFAAVADEINRQVVFWIAVGIRQERNRWLAAITTGKPMVAAS